MADRGLLPPDHRSYHCHVQSPPPYAVGAAEFPFKALAALVGRAPLGGPREAVLATLVAARLADAAAAPLSLPAALRAARAETARLWFSSVALPAATRPVLLKLVDASAGPDLRAIGIAVAWVMEVTAAHLDRAARLELERLGARLAL